MPLLVRFRVLAHESSVSCLVSVVALLVTMVVVVVVVVFYASLQRAEVT